MTKEEEVRKVYAQKERARRKKALYTLAQKLYDERDSTPSSDKETRAILDRMAQQVDKLGADNK